MRQIATFVAAVGLSTACAASTPGESPTASRLEDAGRPLVGVAAPWSQLQGGFGEDVWTAPRDRSNTSKSASRSETVESVAAEAILRLFEQEGLLVLGVDTAVAATGGPQATISATVLYGTGRSHPRQGFYVVGLQEIGGAWSVVSVEAAP
jgi:hypothetical protein